MTVKLLTFLLKYKHFVLTNPDVVNYQSLFAYILRKCISNKTNVDIPPSNVHDPWHRIWMNLDFAMFRHNTQA